MKTSLLLITFLFLGFCNSLHAIELDTVWVSDYSGGILFQHPVSKNIFLSRNGITELYHEDGKFIRELKFKNDFGYSVDLSDDGSKLLYTGDDGLRLIDFYTLNDTLIHSNKYWYPQFLGNDKIVFLSGIKSNTEVGVYNLQNKEFSYYPFPSNNFTAFSASNDGKYVSYATYTTNQDGSSQTRLFLFDAIAMKLITELGSWENISQGIDIIRFAQDSKYLTFVPPYMSNIMPLSIYNLEDNLIVKSYTYDEFQYEIGSIVFLGQDFYIAKGRNSWNQNSEVRIHRRDNNSLLYKTNDFMKYVQTAKFDAEKNTSFAILLH